MDINSLDNITRGELEAQVLRRLLKHLRDRTDVQNIDLMGWGGFCRNCLSDWLAEAAKAQGIEVDQSEARSFIYGMPYEEYKARFQTKATQEQLARIEASVAKNKAAKS